MDNRFDKWLYVIRNLNRLDRVPDKLRERIFEKLFETAEIARFTPEQVRSYEDSLKYYRDIKASLDTKFEEGKIEGKIETAQNAILLGLSNEIIKMITELSDEQIIDIRKNLNTKD